MEREKNGDLHDVDQGQVLSFDIVDERPSRFKSLQSVQHRIFEFGCRCTVVNSSFSRQKDALCCPHQNSQSLRYPFSVLFHFFQRLEDRHEQSHMRHEAIFPILARSLHCEL
jgi:hypothetical protein